MSKIAAPMPPPTAGCTCFRLRRASRRVTQFYDRHLEPSGLKVTQFGLLSGIRANVSISITDLADAMGMDRTTLTRNLKPLLDLNLVLVKEGPDRRTRAVEVTPEGEEMFRRALPLWREAQSALGEAVGGERIVELHRLLDESVRQLNRTCERQQDACNST